MPITFNIYQEIFLVAFSILYGVMLQTYFGQNPFPWGQILRSKKYGIDGETAKRNIKHILGSIAFINIFPFIYAVFVIWPLKRYDNLTWSDPNFYCAIFKFLGWISSFWISKNICYYTG